MAELRKAAPVHANAETSQWRNVVSAYRAPRPASVPGPNGRPLTLDDLPPPDTRRWVARRKAEVVTAVRGGLLTYEEALERWGLTPEEFASWERAMERHGLDGLRVTRLRQFR
jgi:hypothetical protein